MPFTNDQSPITNYDLVVHIDPPMSGADNMRVDQESLDLQKKSDAKPILRFFRWEHPTLSYGRLQHAEAANQMGKDYGVSEIVQRPTGGGMVVHDKDLSFSLAWQRGVFLLNPKDAYRTIHQVVRESVKEMGTDTLFYKPFGKKQQLSGICFSEPVENDILFRNEKIVGGALRMTHWGCLYQGNIKVDLLALNPNKLICVLEKKFLSL